MRNSDVFPLHKPSTSSRPSIAFAILTLLAVSSAPKTATASPVPVTRRIPFFLDFLYPEWYTTNSLSTTSSAERKERLKPERSATTSGSSKPASPADTPQRRPPRPQQSQQQPQLQQRRRRRRQLLTPTPVSPPLAKRTTANGNLVPVKYESIDQAGGWVIDDTWDLHGHHRRAVQDNSTPNTNDSLPVQNLDTTDNSTSYIDTTDTIDPSGDTSNLDLPFGWQEGGLNPRHESYDPVIVAVFAVILVLCIVATIGLCRWRARKLRRLRDLEKLEKEKDGGSDNTSENDESSIGDGSSESGSRFSEKKKKRKLFTSGLGSSSAIRKRFARFRRRHRGDRAKKNGTAEEDKTSDAEEEEQTLNDQVVRDGNDERTRTYAASIASGTSTTLSRSSTSRRSHSSANLESSTPPASTPASNDLAIPIPINGIPPINGVPSNLHPNNTADPAVPANQLSIGGASERGRRSRRGGERPRITVTSSEITPTTTLNTIPTILDPTMAMDMDAPNAEPPAYPASTSTSTNANNSGTGRTRRTRTNTPHLPPEKAPIPGLEAEYDDRDLARGYSLHSGGGGLLTPNSNSGLFNSRLSTSGTGLSARSSAPPTRRPSRVRFADDHAGKGVQDGGENDATDPEEEEQVPSFEPFASSAGTSLGALGPSRAAAGATLRAHVATDDKGLLERLINISSEPPLPPPPPLSPPPPITAGHASSSRVHAHPDRLPPPPAAIVAAAPSFSEIDQWELERQMAQAQAHESASPPSRASLDADSSSSPFTTRGAVPPTLAGASAFGSSSRRAGTSSNGFPALPAPPLPVFNTGGGASGSGDVGYGLGTVWNSLNVGVVTGVPSMPPGSSTSANGNGKARVPSAPPLATPASALRPSAPPQPSMMLDEHMGTNGQVMPSAPPAWDDDEDEDEVDEPILQPGTSSMQGHHAPDVDESRIAHQPNTIPLQDNEGDAGSDGDGAESVISTPPDNEEANSRWSATFRTRPEEGAGLPRYEP